MKDNFLSYVHYFRGFTILFIVGVHCRTSIPWPEGSFTHDILFYGLDFSTILFVFISGFLFQFLHGEKQLDYFSYLLKKLKHVILPYVIVSIPALLDKLLFETDSPWMSDFYKSLAIPFKVLYMLATGLHSGPFYFIPMISLMFLLAPVFHRLQQLKYFSLIALFIVAVGMFSYNYGYYTSILVSLVYFIPVYVFGIWVSKYRVQLVNLNYYLLFGFIFVYAVIFYLEMTDAIYTFRLKVFSEPQYFFTDFNWGKFKMMCLAVILLNVFHQLAKYDFKALTMLGNYSFGIYFIHIYFINVTEMAFRYFQISVRQNLIIFLFYTGFVIMASMLVIYITKKIFGSKSRLIIGS